MSDHVTESLEKDAEGWWEAICSCGAELGMFPTAEDAADALMEHAYRAGRQDAERGQ